MAKKYERRVQKDNAILPPEYSAQQLRRLALWGS